MMYLLFQHSLLNAYHLGCNNYAMLYWAKHNIIPIIRQLPSLWFWHGSLCHPWPQLPLEWGLPPLSCSLLAWSLLDSITLTWSAQMASRWYHGRTQSYWCGMQPVQTPLLPHTSQVPPVGLEQWQPKQRRRRDQSTLTLTPVTCLFLWPLKPPCRTIYPQSMDFLRDVGHNKRVMGEDKCFSYFMQRLSIAVQRGQCHLSDENYCSHVPKAPVFAFASLFFILYILWWSFIPLY